MEKEAEIDRLPTDLLAHIFLLVDSFTDLAQGSIVCKKWNEGVKQSLGMRQSLSFSGLKINDHSIAPILRGAYALRQLLISTSPFSCVISDKGLYEISLANCISNLTSISLWGMIAITDKGVVQLISRTNSLQHLNVGGTFITDESLLAVADSCPHLKSIVLTSCRRVTQTGLVYLVNKCRKLENINTWGTRAPVDWYAGLVTISPALRIMQGGFLPDI